MIVKKSEVIDAIKAAKGCQTRSESWQILHDLQEKLEAEGALIEYVDGPSERLADAAHLGEPQMDVNIVGDGPADPVDLISEAIFECIRSIALAQHGNIFEEAEGLVRSINEGGARTEGRVTPKTLMEECFMFGFITATTWCHSGHDHCAVAQSRAAADHLEQNYPGFLKSKQQPGA